MSWNAYDKRDAAKALISACGSLIQSLAGLLFKYSEATCEEEIEEVEDAIKQFKRFAEETK